MTRLAWPSKSNSPTIYSCNARTEAANVETTINHAKWIIENVFDTPGASDKWTWVVDFNGFSIAHAAQVSLAKEFGALFGDNYPERLG